MSIPLVDDVVAAFSPAVGSLAGIVGAAAAIVLCTVALRLLLLPLTLAAVRGERSRLALAPSVASLRERHRDDPARILPEMQAMYRDAGVSPFAGMLPMLVQAPFVMLWFRFFTAPTDTGRAVLAHEFLGAPLGAHAGAAPWAFVPLVLALVAIGVLTARRGRQVAAANGQPAPHRLFAVLPMLSAVTALFLPLGAALYLVTTVGWTAAESVVLRRGLPAR